MYNILVVDDDKEIVESIEIYLKNEGFNIFKAYNGIEALEILVEKEIHLILMDIMMPKLDGIKATIKIREEKNIPIILVSAKSEDTDKIIGLNIGADDYITKPFNLLELIARVKSNLRRYVTLGNYDNNFNKDINIIISIAKIKEITTKNNDIMAFVNGVDGTGNINITVFPNKYDLIKEYNKNDILLINGRVEKRFNEYQIILNKVKKLN